jgi:MFS family permease
MWQMVSVFMVQLCEAMNVNVLFPFLAFMIEDMGHGGHELGYYAGGLAAAFCGAQFSSSVAWGMVSDNYGRKPAVFLGTLGTAIGMLVFGTAKTYWQAVIGRIIGGVLCGNLGVVKSFLSEITDETNQGKGFSYLSIAWSLGSLMAPLAGGLLCSPADKYPAYFDKDGIFGYYPYLLPCLICIVGNVGTAFFCLAVMEETRKFKKPSSSTEVANQNANSTDGATSPMSSVGDIELTNSSTSVNRTSSNISISIVDQYDHNDLIKRRGLSRNTAEAAKFSILSSEDDEDEDESENRNADASVVHSQIHADRPEVSAHYHPNNVRSMFLTSDINYSEAAMGEKNDSDEEDEAIAEKELPLTESTTVSSIDGDEGDNDGIDENDLCCVFDTSNGSMFACCTSNGRADHQQLSNKDLEIGASSAHGLTTMSPHYDKRRFYGANKRSLVLRQRTVLLATGNYGILAMAYILFDETIPLFLKLSKSFGGLEFSSSQIGFLLSLSGGAMLGFNYYMLPYFISRTSKKSMFEWGIIGSIPFALLWPVIALVNAEILLPSIHNRLSYLSILWPILILVCIVKNVFACLSFTAVMLQINHSVHEEYLGAVNGLGQSLASLARAFGPALGGLLWSISIQNNFVFLNFLSVVFILIVSAIINRYLPDSIDHKKKRSTQQGEIEDENQHSSGGGLMMH